MKKKKAKIIILSVLIGYLLIVGIGYVAMSLHYSSHFLKGTVINGIDASNKSVEKIKAAIQDKIEEYSLCIVKIDGSTEEITAEQVALTYIDDNKVDELLENQNNWAWISSFSNKTEHEFTANATYDQSLVDGIMADMECFQEENITVPQDAYLKDNGTSYEIVPEVEGNQLDQEKVKAAIIEALDYSKTEINLVELDCYLKPSIYQDNEALVHERDTLNRYLQTKLTYDFDDRTEVVDASVIKDWLVKGEDGQWTIDTTKAEEYVQELKYEYDTYGLTHEFTTSNGEKIQLKGGDYGWVIKKQATVDALIQAISEGKEATIEPIYLYEGKCRATNDIGDTYVEVSIEEQRMWCYKNGKLVVDTPVVTGTETVEDRKTPRGSVWAIDGKISPWTLTGEGYSSEVTYWLPFNGNVGIHDANWRSEFGGQIYMTSGSHGCINTPSENAKKVFDAMEIGYPVIVY